MEAAEPTLLRDQYGGVDYDSLPDVIQWFLDHDQRVAVIKHAKVEELFQWKQEQSRLAGEDVFNFNRAEDRLAIGILQSVAHNPTERELHAWIAQLLNALDRASKATIAGSKRSVRQRFAFLVGCTVNSMPVLFVPKTSDKAFAKSARTLRSGGVSNPAAVSPRSPGSPGLGL